MSYHIWTIQPPNYPHAKAFDDLIPVLSQCLNATHSSQPDFSRTNILVGGNLYDPKSCPLPPSLIVYNFEQIFPASPWLNPDYTFLLKNYQVWDYSAANVQALKRHLNVDARHVPLGYHPCMTRIERSSRKDIDILFFGSLNPRRQSVLGDLQSRDLVVLHVFNKYSIARDALIARSKVILNMHYYEPGIFEQVRCSHLLANRCCVVSEESVDCADWPVVFTPYASLAATCENLVRDDEFRTRIELDSFDKFTRMPYSTIINGVINESEKPVGSIEAKYAENEFPPHHAG